MAETARIGDSVPQLIYRLRKASTANARATMPSVAVGCRSNHIPILFNNFTFSIVIDWQIIFIPRRSDCLSSRRCSLLILT